MKNIKYISVLLLILLSATSLLTGKVIYPWRATTAIVKAGETFEVWFQASSGQTINAVELRSPYLTVTTSRSIASGTWQYDHESGNTYNRRITVTVPSSAPADRYDLIVKTSSGDRISPAAVKVVKEYKNFYYIVQLADVHRWQSTSTYPMHVSAKKVGAVIDAANIIGAEIIFECGDHLYNWEGNKSGNDERVNIMFGGTMNWGGGNLHGVQTNTLGLNDATGAVFLVPGNHDSPSKNYQNDASRAVTMNWYNQEYGLAYYNFRYGNGRFMGFNSGMGSIPTHQRNAATSWLNSVGNGNFRVGVGHAGQNPVAGFDNATNLSLLLVGHNHFQASNNPHSLNGKPIQYVANSIRDKGTGNFEYNLFRVNNSTGAFQVLGGSQSRVRVIQNHTEANINNPSSWIPMLELNYNNANNGSSSSTTATFINRHNFAIPDAQVRFIMPKGSTYSVSQGTITQAFDGNTVHVVDVSVNLSANSTTNVVISSAGGTPNNSQFVSQSVPTTLEPGQTVSVSVTMRNTGSDTWTAAKGHRLGSQSPQDNTTWGLNRVTLGGSESIATNQNKTFTFNITAPTTPGVYDFRWRMVDDVAPNQGWFGATTPVVQITVQPSLPANDAQFVSQSVPSTLEPGQSVSVSVTMKNIGSDTWTAAKGHKLGSQPNGSSIWGFSRVDLGGGDSIAPNQNKTFTFNITAPTTPGVYEFRWRMVDDIQPNQGWFGATTPVVQITVEPSLPPNDAVFVSQTVPATLGLGQTAMVSVRMKNTGSATWTTANGHKLGSQNPQDNNTWGFTRVGLSTNVSPNAEHTFNFEITAPTTPGLYKFQWRMVDDVAPNQGWFGDFTPSSDIMVVEASGLQPIKVNFQTATASVPSGYLADTSQVFGNRGNGYTYGWTTSFDRTRERNNHSDKRLDTLNHTQWNGDRVWEIEVPNGDYQVSITGGDPDFDNSFIEFVAEAGTANEVLLSSGNAAGVNFVSGSAKVTVSDGRLTISNGPNAVNNKINYVDITPFPAVSFDMPPSAILRGENLHLKLNASAASGIDRVYLYKNGVELARSETAAPYEFGAPGQNDPELQNMQEGVYEFTALARDMLGNESEAIITVAVVVPGYQPPLYINFQPSSASVPSGYLADTSQVFGNRGNGYSYGWTAAFNETRERNVHTDKRLDTFNHMQHNGANQVWEVALPNGDYLVRLTGGDPSWDNSFIEFVAEEGTANEVILASRDAEGVNFVSGSVVVSVGDGRLTISNGPNGVNNKINYVDITPLEQQPTVNINFQTAAAAVPSGYLADTSQLFGDRGNGFSYGWTTSFDMTRERNSHSDKRLDTLNHTQAHGVNRVWQIELPNGDYSVSLTGGDPDFQNSFIHFVAQAGSGNAVTLVNGSASGVNFVSGSGVVTVSNGLLTISNGANAVNNKINYVDIRPVTNVKINFQTAAAAVPSGYLADTSQVFGDRGNGYSYGWTTAFDRTRERNSHSDKRLDTLNHMQWNADNYVWQIELPNGDYDVSITGGDPDFQNSFIHFVAQAGTGNAVTLASGSTAGVNFVSGSGVVTVSNGLLTISNGANAVNNKINYIDIVTSLGGYGGNAFIGDIGTELDAYATWKADHDLTDDLGDEDNDGISNLLEFALGGDPRTPGSAKLPQISVNGDTLEFTLQRQDEAITYVIQKSTDLINWVDFETVTDAHGPVGGKVTVTVPAPEMGASQLFLRLRVERK